MNLELRASHPRIQLHRQAAGAGRERQEGNCVSSCGSHRCSPEAKPQMSSQTTPKPRPEPPRVQPHGSEPVPSAGHRRDQEGPQGTSRFPVCDHTNISGSGPERFRTGFGQRCFPKSFHPPKLIWHQGRVL